MICLICLNSVTERQTKLFHCVYFLCSFFPLPYFFRGFSGGTSGKKRKKKKPACQCRRHKRHGFDPWVGKIPWRRKQQPTPVFLPGEPHGQRSLANYSPWGCRFGHKWSDLVHFFWYLRKSLGFCPNGPSYINSLI